MTISGPIAGLLACTVTYLFTAIGSALVFILPSNWLTDHTHPAHTIVVAIASGMMLAAVMELSGKPHLLCSHFNTGTPAKSTT